MTTKIFNHVQIKVQKLSVSKKFYDSVMKALDYGIVLEIDDNVIGYGATVHDMFEIRQAGANYPKSNSIHIAFNANNIESVHSFYKAALKNGGSCNGKPGLRPEYEKGYYSAFVIDPDGNNIEAVFSEKIKK